MPYVSTADSRIWAAINAQWPAGVRMGEDYQQFREWRRDLRAARVQFLEHKPLSPARKFVVSVAPPKQLGARPLPRFAAVRGSIEITLKAPFAGSPRVWLATTPAGDSVVAKFYYPSFDIPERQCVENVIRYEYLLPRQHALAEEIAYDILGDAQGRWLPYFLGRTEIQLSHGETADVLLFEYIPGRTLSELRKLQIEYDDYGDVVPHTISEEPGSKFQMVCKQHQKWFIRLHDTIHEMHDIGICHLHLYGRNILVPDDKPDELILIDFEMAQNDFAARGDLETAVAGFACCQAHMDALWQYCKKNGYPETMEWYHDLRDPL